MKKFFMLRRIIIAILIPSWLGYCFDAQASTLRSMEEQIKLSIKQVEVESTTMIIRYEITLPATDKYEVSVVMLNERIASLKIPVKTATGDVGEKEYTSGEKQIKWDYRKDCSEKITGDGFYVEITVNRVSGSNWWLYTILGAAIIGGGAAALGGKKSGDDKSIITPPGSTSLPLPPARPGN
ncbi:MAG: hypothetical protein V1799_04930 [bacterium]